MIKLGVFLAVIVSLLLVACGGGGGAESTSVVVDREVVVEKPVVVERGVEAIKEVVTERPPVLGTPAPSPSQDAGGLAFSATTLEIAERKIISVASLSVEVEVVQEAVTQVRVIAESLGGFVEQMSTYGGAESQRANMTIRVPQEQFFTALDRIAILGEVQSQNVGSEDVSEQFIDLEARLRSSLREEQSLLSLLEKAEMVSEILTIERELSRVRSEIERFQGQLNFLERRVDLATISVSLFPPEEKLAVPPSASLTVEASDVAGSVEQVKALVSNLDGVMDNVFLTVRDGEETAIMSLRVFTPNFEQAMTSIENQGKVKSKELREGTPAVDGGEKTPEEPDARIDVTFVEKERVPVVGLIIGGVILAVALGTSFYLAYRAGRRRSGTTAQA